MPRPVFGPVLSVIRSAAHAQRLLTLAEVQAEVAAAADRDQATTEWLVRTVVPRRETRVIAQTRSFARNIGAAVLGVAPDRVVVGRVDTVTTGAALVGKATA